MSSSPFQHHLISIPNSHFTPPSSLIYPIPSSIPISNSNFDEIEQDSQAIHTTAWFPPPTTTRSLSSSGSGDGNRNVNGNVNGSGAAEESFSGSFLLLRTINHSRSIELRWVQVFQDEGDNDDLSEGKRGGAGDDFWLLQKGNPHPSLIPPSSSSNGLPSFKKRQKQGVRQEGKGQNQRQQLPFPPIIFDLPNPNSQIVTKPFVVFNPDKKFSGGDEENDDEDEDEDESEEESGSGSGSSDEYGRGSGTRGTKPKPFRNNSTLTILFLVYTHPSSSSGFSVDGAGISGGAGGQLTLYRLTFPGPLYFFDSTLLESTASFQDLQNIQQGGKTNHRWRFRKDEWNGFVTAEIGLNALLGIPSFSAPVGLPSLNNQNQNNNNNNDSGLGLGLGVGSGSGSDAIQIFSALDERTVLIADGKGKVWKVEQELEEEDGGMGGMDDGDGEEDGGGEGKWIGGSWRAIPLRQAGPSSLNPWTALSRFSSSTRNNVVPPGGDQILSLSPLSSADFRASGSWSGGGGYPNQHSIIIATAFSLDRALKLKIWNLVTSELVKAIPLPRKASDTKVGRILQATSEGTPAPMDDTSSAVSISAMSGISGSQLTSKGLRYPHQVLLPPTVRTLTHITANTRPAPPARRSAADETIDSEDLSFDENSEGDKYSSFLTVYVPSTSPPSAESSEDNGYFVVFGVAIDEHKGVVKDAVELAIRDCRWDSAESLEQSDPDASMETETGRSKNGKSDLVDFALVRDNPNVGTGVIEREDPKTGAKKSPWTLWTLWDEEDSPGGVVRFVEIPELDDPEPIIGDPPRILSETPSWTTIVHAGDDWQENAQWNAAYFDELLGSGVTSGKVTEIFLNHIFANPSRYPYETLEYALLNYHDSLVTSGKLPPTFKLEDYDSVQERVVALVASNVHLERSFETGEELYDKFAKDLKLEWLRFVALLNEHRERGLQPLTLACGGGGAGVTGMQMIVGRENIAALVIKDTVVLLEDFIAEVRGSEEKERNGFKKIPRKVLDTSYPLLAKLSTRKDHLGLTEAGSILATCFSSDKLAALESDIATFAQGPRAFSIEELAGDLWERRVNPSVVREVAEDVANILQNLVEKDTCWNDHLHLLTTHDGIGRAPRPSGKDAFTDGYPTCRSCDFFNAILAENIGISVDARYSASRGFVLLLLFVYGELMIKGEDANEETLDSYFGGGEGQFAGLLSSSIATMHTWAIWRWITKQTAVPKPDTKLIVGDEGADLASRLGVLNVNDNLRITSRDELDTVPSFSLLHALIQHRYRPSLDSHFPIAQNIARSVSSVFNATGLVAQKRMVVASPSDVAFAHRLCSMGMPSLALEMTDMYPKGAGMTFVSGLASLSLNRFDDAQAAFEQAAAALYEENLRLDDDSGLFQVLPMNASGGLGQYYRHITNLFEGRLAHHQIGLFCRLALESQTLTPNQNRDLWSKLFRSHAELHLYRTAYNTLMAIPFNDLQTECLRNLISVMCECGAVDELLKFSFGNLRKDFEGTLDFRARNSDPLTLPNYYRILYSYHVSRSDYRSAAFVMYQQASRIGHLPHRNRDSMTQTAAIQCQCYLAAMNALTLVDKKNAWLVVPVDTPMALKLRRRPKIKYTLPDGEFGPDASRVDVIEADDIRKEHTMVVSVLELSTTEFPELAQTHLSIDPATVVSLYSQSQSYETAFTKASILGVDMTSLFENVTEKCVRLNQATWNNVDTTWISKCSMTSSWEGSVATRAWRFLEIQLDRYDQRGEGWKYRAAVLEKILSLDRICALPAWLTSFYMDHDPAHLIRSLMRYELLRDAFQYSIDTIQKVSSKQFKPPYHTSMVWLPYTCFDQLLAWPPEEAEISYPDGLSREEFGVLCKSLQKVINGWLAKAESLDAEVRKAAGLSTVRERVGR